MARVKVFELWAARRARARGSWLGCCAQTGVFHREILLLLLDFREALAQGIAFIDGSGKRRARAPGCGSVVQRQGSQQGNRHGKDDDGRVFHRGN